MYFMYNFCFDMCLYIFKTFNIPEQNLIIFVCSYGSYGGQQGGQVRWFPRNINSLDTKFRFYIIFIINFRPTDKEILELVAPMVDRPMVHTVNNKERHRVQVMQFIVLKEGVRKFLRLHIGYIVQLKVDIFSFNLFSQKVMVSLRSKAMVAMDRIQLGKLDRKTDDFFGAFYTFKT